MGRSTKRAASEQVLVAPPEEHSDSDSDQSGLSEDEGVMGCATQAAPEQEEKSFTCEFCAFSYNSARIVNGGSREYPKWRCKACHSASRWYDKTLKSKNWDVAKYKKQKSSCYTRHVLKFRLWKKGDPVELQESGLSSRKERYSAFLVIEETLQFEVYNEEHQSIGWLTKRQYIGYHVTWEAYKESEVLTMWDEQLTKTTVERKNIKGEIVLPVLMPEYITNGVRASEIVAKKKKKKAASDDSDGEKAFEDECDTTMVLAAKKKKPSKVASAGMGDFDKIVSMTPASKPMKKQDSQQGRGALTQATLDEFSVASASTGKGSKKRKSDDALEDEGKSLTQARTETRSVSKRLRSQMWKNRGADIALLDEVVAKLGSNHEEVVTCQVDQKKKNLDDALGVLEEMAKNSTHWVGATYKDKFKEFRGKQAEVVRCGAEVSAALNTLKHLRLTNVQEKGFQSRRLGLKSRNYFKANPLPPQGFPATLVSWLGADVLQLTLENDDTEVVPSSCIISVVDGSEVDWTKILFFAEDAAGDDIGTFRRVLGADAGLNIDDAIGQLRSHFASVPGSTLNMIKLQTGGSSKPTDVAMWIPESLKAQVSHSLGAAGPWLYGATKFGFRGDPKWIALPGQSGFIHCIEGPVVLILTPVASILQVGATPATLVSMLNNLTPSQAGAFMNTHCAFMMLGKGETAFVPFGMMPWLLSMESHTFVLHVPVLATSLVDTKATSVPPTVNYLLHVMDSKKDTKPWKKMNPLLKVWFGQFGV